MRRIIEKGVIPNQIHRATCGGCYTIFEYDEQEVVRKRERRSYFSGPRLVECPVCDKHILLNILYEQI